MPASDPPSASRAPLPEGTIPVAIGLVITGISAFAFLKVGQSALGGEAQFAPVLALWFATFALAPGFFLPLEQELGRALSHRRALGQGGQPVVRRVITLGLLLLTTVTVLVLIASPLLTQHYFDGDWVLVAALIVSFAAYAPTHISRGIASGNGRFRAYAVLMGLDGVVRIVLCGVLAVIGVKSAGPYGFAVALSPVLGVLYVLGKGDLRTEPGPEAAWQEVTPNLGWLMIGSVFAAGLVNAGPLAANILKSADQKALVTSFGKGVLLSRIPLFMFQAVQAALLPRLSRLAARNELAEFRAGFKRLVVMVIAVGAIGVIGAYAVGPTIIRRVYGSELSSRTMAMLALGSAAYMLALALAQAVIALKGHSLVALGWSIGMVTFVVVTWLTSHDLFRRIEYGLVASSVAALVAFAVALRSRLNSGATPTTASMMDAITDMPLET